MNFNWEEIKNLYEQAVKDNRDFSLNVHEDGSWDIDITIPTTSVNNASFTSTPNLHIL